LSQNANGDKAPSRFPRQGAEFDLSQKGNGPCWGYILCT
jgi:hypothetical protein